MMHQRFRFLFVLLNIALVSFGPFAAAQNEQLPTEPQKNAAPAKIPDLPDPRDRSAKFLLNQQNSALFQDMLLAPVASWIDSDLFTARLYSGLDFSWLLSESWEEKTRQNPGKYDLTGDFTLAGSEESLSGEGLPFGRAEVVDQETDVRTKAYKILWNMAACEGAAKDLLYEVELSWMGAQSVVRQSEGIFYRRFFPKQFAVTQQGGPSADEAQSGAATGAGGKDSVQGKEAGRGGPTLQGNDVFMQEVLQLTSPPVVFGFAQISWRHRSNEEDQGWIYSPVIGKSRRVLSANRSDPLLGDGLTVDDLFVWSAKIQSVDARVVGDKTLLVPVPALAFYLAEFEEAVGTTSAAVSAEAESKTFAEGDKKKGGEKVLTVRGYYQRSDSSYTTTLWNGETRQYMSQAAWVPTSAAFVPRRVWIIELAPKDPFYTSGREILIVDKEAMLPVYKIVYGHDGSYQRIVLGGWALASTKDGKIRFPFSAFVVAVDSAAREAMAMTTRYARTFLGQDSPLARKINALLDIFAHGKEAKETREADAKAQGPESKGKAGAGTGEGASEAGQPSPED
jgi:hypothetical protein